MMTRHYASGLSMLAGALMLATAAYPQPAAAPSVDGPASIQNYLLAQKLYRYGTEANDALSVITASNLLSRVQPAAIKAAEKKGSKDAAAAGPDKAQAFASLDEMKTKAKSMAGENAALKALAADLDDTATRNLVSGPKEARDVIYPGEQLVYTEVFQGNEIGQAILLAPLNSKLSLRVYAAGNMEMCQPFPREKVNGMEAVACNWDTRSTGSLQVVIANNGRNSSEFYLLLP